MPKLSKESRYLHSEHSEQPEQSGSSRPSSKLAIKSQIEQYIYANLAGNDDWTTTSEIPTESEIGWIENGAVKYKDFHIPVSKTEGPYESKEKYLSTQYKLMRIDGTMPLAKAVDEFRCGIVTSDSNDYKVYDEVFITGVAVARDGLAFKIEFSGTSLGRLVRWAKSKRLRSGSLVALTPASDNFRTKCVPAIVASRLLEDLEVQAPLKPSIHVYIGDPNQIEIDPQQKWVMLECTQGYWEAYRHTLKALQKVRIESFPIQEYLVDMQTGVKPPSYRLQSPTMDVSFAGHSEKMQLKRLNVLQQWPEFEEIGAPRKDPGKIASDMDSSQIEALKRILTKKLAIIQGPPGTGKTYTSVCAIKILLDNMTRNDPPIIIAAQTNHAVDQILRHISKFEPEFVRLGGQTTDQDVIKPRTLYELKGNKKQVISAGTRAAAGARKAVGGEFDRLLQPIRLDDCMSADMFFEHGLITQTQRDSINTMESKWIADTSPNRMNLWCNNHLAKIINVDKVDAYAAQLEEEHENLDERELEAPDNEDDKFEYLNGRKFEFCSGYRLNGRPSGISDEEIMTLLSTKQDFQQIPDQHRPEVYDYLRRELTRKITDRVRKLGHKCIEAATSAKAGRWETDYDFICSARVIGLTTTGLSKYRGLLSILNPKIVLIEEAAETLEPYTVAAVFNSLEHLILVGDHQQLRANCSYSDLIGEPVHFDISLFERLVKNNIEFTVLNTQRRMRPEIRKLIKHIYPRLVDHSSVMDRPDIGGMGGSNVWFWHHDNEESVDEAKSKQNPEEGRMVIEFTKYLVWNNIPLDKITILTFYNGQKKFLQENFHKHDLFKGYKVKICTVDSYQGEENDVVILSLVRNNKRSNIGFLNSSNRACVALSRARIGFYMLGNARLLISCPHWAEVIAELQASDAVRQFLPLYCPVHNEILDAKTFTDLEGLHGGCDADCSKKLPCGHQCPLKCHPGRGCKVEDCQEPCPKILDCTHQCTSGCAAACECRVCAEQQRRSAMYYHFETANSTPSLGHLRYLDEDSLPTSSNVLPRDQFYKESPLSAVRMPTPAEAAELTNKWSNIANSASRQVQSAADKATQNLVDLTEAASLEETAQRGRQIRRSTLIYQDESLI